MIRKSPLELKVQLGRAGLALELAKERRRQGLSQSELAMAVAISQQQLSKLENGGNCRLNTLLKVCASLGLELSIWNRSPGATGNRHGAEAYGGSKP